MDIKFTTEDVERFIKWKRKTKKDDEVFDKDFLNIKEFKMWLILKKE